MQVPIFERTGAHRVARLVAGLGVVAVFVVAADALALQQRETASGQTPPSVLDGGADVISDLAPPIEPVDSADGPESLVESHRSAGLSPGVSLAASPSAEHLLVARLVVEEVRQRDPSRVAESFEGVIGLGQRQFDVVGRGVAYNKVAWIEEGLAGVRLGAVDVFDVTADKAGRQAGLPVAVLGAESESDLVSPAASEPTVVVGERGDLFAARLDPDGGSDVVVGRALAVLRDGDLVIVERDGGTDIVRTGLRSATSLAISRDGRMLAVSTNDGIALLAVGSDDLISRGMPSAGYIPVPPIDRNSADGLVHVGDDGERLLVTRLDLGSWSELMCRAVLDHWTAAEWVQLGPGDGDSRVTCHESAVDEG